MLSLIFFVCSGEQKCNSSDVTSVTAAEKTQGKSWEAHGLHAPTPVPTPLKGKESPRCIHGESVQDERRTRDESVRVRLEEVKRLVNLYRGEELSITMTRHSLGATLALLDVITRLPEIFVSEELEEKIWRVGGGVLEETTSLAYSHVGSELCMKTKMLSFLKSDADMACCHDLEAYLHLVDGFLASNCLFKANAKRS
ncbi:Phospholipase A1-Ibeta2 [Vigna angularis]|uniref:Phospholipase A1-Ibeta2 n=1 Tax=Phaseolus angularis TaxID=3914 RepID=A0A8T0JTR0_PHAAN|nr:Phospholipase A1-Ibeta2 [Vigna angularis]